MVLQSVNTKKCTLTSRSECTKSNETLKETFRAAKLQNFSVSCKFILYYLIIVNHYLYRSRMDRRYWQEHPSYLENVSDAS